MIPMVLCVDDESFTLVLHKLVLAKAAFCKEIITAENGRTALDDIEESLTLPDLILLDLNMPVMDGWEFLEELSNDSRLLQHPIKVVILSSSVNPKDRERAETYSLCSGFIPKPLTVGSLDELKRHPDFRAFFDDAG